MRTPLEDYSTWIEIEHAEIPAKIKEIAEHIHDLNWKVKSIEHGYRNSVEAVFKSQEILSVIISNFNSLFQHSADMLKKKNEQDVKKIQNDLINMQREIKNTTTNLTLRPEDKLYPAVFFHIKQLIVEPINSLIGAVLIDCWRDSKKIIYRNVDVGIVSRRYDKKEFISYDENKFYETLYVETIRRTGQHPMFTVFKTPTKTMASPVLSPTDKRELVLGLYDEMKNEQKNKQEFAQKIPEELTQKEDSEKEANEVIFEEESEEIEEEDD